MPLMQKVGSFQFMSDGSIVVEDGKAVFPPGLDFDWAKYKGVVLESHRDGTYTARTPKGERLFRFEGGRWTIIPASGRPAQHDATGEPVSPPPDAPQGHTVADGSRTPGWGAPGQPGGGMLRPGVTLSYRALGLIAATGLVLLAATLYFAFFGGRTVAERDAHEVADAAKDKGKPKGGEGLADEAAPAKAKDEGPVASTTSKEAAEKEAAEEAKRVAEAKQRRWWQEEVKLTAAEEQTLLRLIASSKRACDKMANDSRIAEWWFGAVKALEPQFREGVVRNNAFASRELRDRWRALSERRVTDAQGEVRRDRPGGLDTQITQGGPITREDLKAFQDRLRTEGEALKDLADQERDLKAFFRSLPEDYYARNFDVRLTEAEAKALSNPEVLAVCVRECFSARDLNFKMTEHSQRVRNAQVPLTEAEADFLDKMEPRIRGWLFNRFGVMCELRQAGLEPSRMAEDYRASLQVIDAVLGGGPMPSRPSGELFAASAPPAPPREPAQPKGEAAEEPAANGDADADGGVRPKMKKRGPKSQGKGMGGMKTGRDNQNQQKAIESLKKMF